MIQLSYSKCVLKQIIIELPEASAVLTDYHCFCDQDHWY